MTPEQLKGFELCFINQNAENGSLLFEAYVGGKFVKYILLTPEYTQASDSTYITVEVLEPK